MTRREPVVFLESIVEYAEKIARFIDGMTEETFLEDERTILAVIRCFEVIGEAANQVPKTLQAEFADIPWAEVIAFRNVLIHEYLGVSMKRVWATATTALPETLPSFQRMLAALRTV